MAQVKTGTVSVTNGSNVVTGSGTQFLTDGVTAGAGFILQVVSGVNGAGVYYTVGGSVTESGLELSSNWAGDDADDVAYVIHIDFLAPGYPALLPGDLEVKPILNRVITRLLNAEGLFGATTDTAGIVKFATEAQDIAGTADDLASTPNGVRKAYQQYGLGFEPPLVVIDYNTYVDNIDKNIIASVLADPSSANGPPEADFYYVTHYCAGAGASGNCTQFADPYRSGFSGWYRVRFGGAWSNWVKRYGANNVNPSAQNLLDNGSYGLGTVAPSDVVSSTSDNTTTFGYASTGTTLVPNNMPFLNISAVRDLFIGGRLGELYFATGGGDGATDDDARKVYHDKNILSPVSQSGGVPTGGIIERGSNSNGEYVKFADGTMICNINVVLADLAVTDALGAVFYNATVQTVTFPASFSTASGMTESILCSGANVISARRQGQQVTTSFSFQLITAVSETQTYRVTIQIIGRWY